MTRRSQQLLSATTVVGLALAAVALTFALQSAKGPSVPAASTPQGNAPLAPAPRVDPAADAAPAEARFGYVPNREGTEQFIRSLGPRPDLRTRAPGLFRGVGDDQPVLLYRALYEAYAAHHGGQRWVVEAQGIGDCVSWGWCYGVDIHSAVLWKLKLQSTWKASATEAVYGGSRVEARGKTSGGYRDGSYGGAAAKWVRDWGVLFRQPYDTVDLSTYSSQRAKDWGNYGCGGRDDGGRLDAIAKQHPVKDVALVTSWDEAEAAIRSGYPIAVCSGQGFSRTRDAKGFSRASGSWAHCMCFIGVRSDREGLLCLNSWGPSWISGPKWPEDQPEGSFWVDRRTVESMLASRDSFAISGFEGFPYRELDHGAWVAIEPPAAQQYTRRLGNVAAEADYALAP